MNVLKAEKRRAVIAALVEGASINSTARMTEVSKPTILRLLADLGTACAKYQDEKLRNLPCKRLQCDEIWSFCYAKEKNVPEKLQGRLGFGDVWTFTAICADTKLVPSWFVGRRDTDHATVFVKDLASRLANRVQLTTDGHRMYLEAIEEGFGADIDYAQLVKLYNDPPSGIEKRYSPGECCGTRKSKITGNPDPASISTSYVERQNLTMRMSMRRFTRLTNAHSKKIQNHQHALALYFMYYNFARIHLTLRVTPAMEAGVSDHVWSVEEIIGLLD